MTMKQVMGLDVGNGYTKGLVKINDGKRVPFDILSGVAHVIESNDIKVKDEAAKPVIDDILNNLDASFDSNLIPDTSRRLFGRRGVASGMTYEEFNVDASVSKADQFLSGVMILGSVAAMALKHYYEEHGKLPEETIKVETSVAVALPITEYKYHRKSHAKKLMAQSHVVMIHNFESPVRFEIKFTEVSVLAEGASAQFAIISKGEELMKAMLQDLKNAGEEDLDIDPKDLLRAKNVLGIDIGEGTVNFPVFTNGTFNTDASYTFSKGYGNIMTTAMETLNNEAGLNFKNRKALVDFSLEEKTSLNKYRKNTAEVHVDRASNIFSKELSREFIKVLSVLGAAGVDVVYIYGGGATPIKKWLQKDIIEAAKLVGKGELMFPILYLDSRYSRYLNREGLFIIADRK